jgi:hypothetical protein
LSIRPIPDAYFGGEILAGGVRLFAEDILGFLHQSAFDYRDGGEGNPKRLVEAASRAFSIRSNFLTIRESWIVGLIEAAEKAIRRD